MKLDPKGLLRDARYALPGLVERNVEGPDARQAARVCQRLRRAGLLATCGYFQRGDSGPDEIVEACVALCAELDSRSGTYLSVKAPPLGFDAARLDRIAEAANTAGLDIMFDAHAPKDTDATLDAVERMQVRYPRTGLVLPARWARSESDAARFRETGARVRVVKGEWPDPEQPPADLDAAYLSLVSALAGRAAPVAVATHRPELAEQALSVLIEAGTPCELEQLRGLPRRRTKAVARRLGVPVRIYVPFGPGWLPYALDKALATPHLPRWMLADLLG